MGVVLIELHDGTLDVRDDSRVDTVLSYFELVWDLRQRGYLDDEDIGYGLGTKVIAWWRYLAPVIGIQRSDEGDPDLSIGLEKLNEVVSRYDQRRTLPRHHVRTAPMETLIAGSIKRETHRLQLAREAGWGVIPTMMGRSPCSPSPRSRPPSEPDAARLGNAERRKARWLDSGDRGDGGSVRDRMRVAVVFDMEGTSHITDLREPFPTYREYWETGRAKLTDDIVAATRGLLAGGATEVWIYNHHGAGEVEWPNVIVERLPDGTRLAEDWNKLEMRDHVDAMFQVGAHARGGNASFLSHTILPGLRLRLDGELLSESHWWAWTGNVPVLGIVGSGELGGHAWHAGRRAVPGRPAEPGPSACGAGLRLTAGHGISNRGVRCGRHARCRRSSHCHAGRPDPPRGERPERRRCGRGHGRGRLDADGQDVLCDRSGFVARRRRADRRGDRARGGCRVGPLFLPLRRHRRDLGETALAYPADQAARDEAFLESWAADPTPEWFEPSAADGPWEGFA